MDKNGWPNVSRDLVQSQEQAQKAVQQRLDYQVVKKVKYLLKVTENFGSAVAFARLLP